MAAVTQWGCNVPTGIAIRNENSGTSKDTTKKKNERFKITELFPLAPPASVAREGDESMKDYTERDYFSNVPDSVLVSHEQHLDQALRPGRELTAEDIYLYKDGSEAVRYCFYPPYWIFDALSRTLRCLRPRISPLLQAMYNRDPTFYITFLMRRGFNACSAPLL